MFDLLIVSLAVYRASRMIAMEDGPLDIFKRWKSFIASKFPPDEKSGQQHWIDRGFNCPLCIGIWATVVVYATWLWLPFGQLIVTILAVAGLQAIIQRLIG